MKANKKNETKKPRAKKTELQALIDENKVTNEVLADLEQQIKAVRTNNDNVTKRYAEQLEGFFYVSIVFQNDACAKEFCTTFKDFMGIEDDQQIFIDGHELAARLGKPLKTPFIKKTANIDRITNQQAISEVGIYGE